MASTTATQAGIVEVGQTNYTLPDATVGEYSYGIAKNSNSRVRRKKGEWYLVPRVFG
jgi:hypothetical protein